MKISQMFEGENSSLKKTFEQVFEEQNIKNKGLVKVRTEKGIMMMTQEQFDNYKLSPNLSRLE